MPRPKYYHEFDDLLIQGKYREAVALQTRQVKWLYLNSNKLTKVVSDKDVHMIVHTMQNRIDAFTEQLNSYRELDKPKRIR